jgi:hypothetical protein
MNLLHGFPLLLGLAARENGYFTMLAELNFAASNTGVECANCEND